MLGASLVEGMARVDQGLLSKAEAAFREEMSLLEGVAAPGRDMEWVRQRAEVVLQMARLLSLSHEYMESAGGQVSAFLAWSLAGCRC